ncbi:MAG: hypothetical protein KGD61_08570 [Candidatus Lokiarchaeota archaeon]|nr:hypothetical protein [Candidatus Lokiarchaeota archaeon]
MTDEDFYIGIIDLLENSKVVLANYMLNYLTRKIDNNEVLKNCLIILLLYLRQDLPILDNKRSKSIDELDGTHKKTAINILKEEFVSL